MDKIETRARLLATSALCAAALPSLAAAATATATATTTESQPAATAVSEVVVTGTHIPKPNLEQPAPVEVIPQQLIADTPTQELGSIIAQLPALSAQATVRSNANSFGTSGGLDFADLRNLGSNRTLVLVDGKRHVPGDPNSEAVDLSSIPPALVDRVEVVTGGASAIYGSDALAGVVNIILKKNFNGVQFDAAGGELEGGPGAHYNLDLTVGHSFLNDRLNVTLTGIYDHQNNINATDIHALRNFGVIVNPNDLLVPGDPSQGAIPHDGIPDLLIVPNVLSNGISSDGVLVDLVPLIFGGSLNDAIVTAFNKLGQPVPQTLSVGFNSFAFGSFPNGCAECFRVEDFENIVPETVRAGGDIRLAYDITPKIRFTLDGKYIRNTVYDYVQPSFTFFQDFLQPDNAFITPALAAQLAPVFAVDNAFGIPGPFINRFLTDLGNRTEKITRETYRIVADLTGTTDARFADVTWDVSYNYGTTRNHLIAGGNRISGNFEAALDSVIDPNTGQPACRINVPSAQPPGFVPPAGLVGPPASCVPYDPFGQNNSQAALNYISRPLPQFEAITQQVIDAGFNFDSSRFFSLPGGPIGVAFGGEYRRESLENIQDPLVIQGLTEVAPTPNAFGKFNVYEGYVEANAPILKHQFLADEVSIDAAYRIAHYSTVGNVDAWKVSGVYGPFDWIKLRGTYSRAVRAPNLTEAFLPPTGTFFFITDPCDASVINSNANFPANCAAAGIPPGFVANANVSPPGQVTGNPNLKPERSISYTVGLVFQPTKWVPNLSVTVDYYNIKIKDAISLLAAQDILNNCYGGANGLDQQFCSLITRGADHNITFITSTYLNTVEEETSGIETQINYFTDVGPWTQKMGFLKMLDGRLSATADVNWLYRLRNFPFQSSPSQFQVLEGRPGWPEWKGLFTLSYAQGPFRVDWSTNWISQVDRYSKDPGAQDPADQIFPLFVGAQWYDNVVLHYIQPVNGAKADFYFGVENILNAQPPPNVITGNPQGPDGSALYSLGREFFAGVRAKF